MVYKQVIGRSHGTALKETCTGGHRSPGGRRGSSQRSWRNLTRGGAVEEMSRCLPGGKVGKERKTTESHLVLGSGCGESACNKSHKGKGSPEKPAGRRIYYLSEVFGKSLGSYVIGMLRISKHSSHTHWQSAPRTMWVTAELCLTLSPLGAHMHGADRQADHPRYLSFSFSLSPHPQISFSWVSKVDFL